MVLLDLTTRAARALTTAMLNAGFSRQVCRGTRQAFEAFGRLSQVRKELRGQNSPLLPANGTCHLD